MFLNSVFVSYMVCNNKVENEVPRNCKEIIMMGKPMSEKFPRIRPNIYTSVNSVAQSRYIDTYSIIHIPVTMINKTYDVN